MYIHTYIRLAYGYYTVILFGYAATCGPCGSFTLRDAEIPGK